MSIIIDLEEKFYFTYCWNMFICEKRDLKLLLECVSDGKTVVPKNETQKHGSGV